MNTETAYELHEQARNLITFLGFPEAVTAAGKLWCEMQAVMLHFNLNSCTPEEGNERLLAQVNAITAKLGAIENLVQGAG